MKQLHDDTEHVGDALDRQAQIEQIISDCMKVSSEGGAVSFDKLIGAHPDLMPELGEELEQLTAIENGLQGLRLGDDRGVRAGDGMARGSCLENGDEFQPGDHIDRYRILGKLGEGGMGTVFAAEQLEPIRRRVALKVIKLGMNTKQVVARFESERRALAVMDHPNIARVLDAGCTQDGRAYFVMEHVKGEPIIAYCDRHHLDNRRRIELFIQVCHAIQHAHYKGIIHRDVKPSNVLVTILSNEPFPKVIDFGVAKATEQNLTERTLFTEQGQVIGTPEYMSPEQAEMTGLDIDTRTDIYSLGVMLYEMLVGVLPFESDTLRKAGIGEIQRIIREVEPPKPSRRVSTMGEEASTIVAHRNTNLHTLKKRLRRDLDWIIMRAIDKDRTRRYETVSGLAQDLQRYLNNDPVLAGPPSAVYRLSKFLHKNRRLVTAMAAVFVALIVGLAGTTWQWRRAVESEARERDAKQRAHEREQEAVAAQGDAEAVTDYLTAWLSSVNPERQGIDVTLREMLDKASETIGDQFEDRPLLEARLRGTVGRTYVALGLFGKAKEHLGEAAAIYLAQLGDRDRLYLRAVSELGVALDKQGDPTEASGRLRRTVETQRRVLGEEHPHTLASMNNLAISLHSQGELAEAESLHRGILEIRRRVLGDEHPSTLSSMNNLAIALRDLGDYAEAERLHRQTLGVKRRTLGEEHPRTLGSMHNLALSLYSAGKFAEAETLHEETLEIKRRILGEEHPSTLKSTHGLAISRTSRGDYCKAEVLHRKTLTVKRRVLGEEHPDTLGSMSGLADSFHSQGKYSEAESLCVRILEIRSRIRGEENPLTLSSMNNLANVLYSQGKFSEAEALHRRVLENLPRDWGEDNLLALSSRTGLAIVLTGRGEYAEAEALHRTTLEIKRRVLSEDNPRTLESMNGLAAVLEAQGEHGAAEKLHDETWAIRARVLGTEHPDTLESMTAVQRVLEVQGKVDLAKSLAGELIEFRRRRAEDPNACAQDLNAYAMILLGYTGEALCQPKAALPVAKSAAQITGRKSYDILKTLALAYKMTGDIDRAVETQRETLSLFPQHESPVRIDLAGRLGAYLVEQEKYPEAEPLLLAWLAQLSEKPVPPRAESHEALEHLVTLFEARDAAEPGTGYGISATRWRGRLAELQRGPLLDKD